MAPRSGLDREAVLRAAAVLSDASGADRLSLTALAMALGVRTPSLYNHVEGLPGLRRALALRGSRDLAWALAISVLGRAREDAVRAMADAYRTFVRAHPGIYDLMMRARPADRAADRDLDQAELEPVQVALAVLAGYDLHGDAALHAVRGLRAVVHGFATLEAAGGFGLPLDVDESFRRLLDMYLAGLRLQAGATEAARGRS